MPAIRGKTASSVVRLSKTSGTSALRLVQSRSAFTANARSREEGFAPAELDAPCDVGNQPKLCRDCPAALSELVCTFRRG